MAHDPPTREDASPAAGRHGPARWMRVAVGVLAIAPLLGLALGGERTNLRQASIGAPQGVEYVPGQADGCIFFARKHKQPIRCVVLSKDGRYAFSGGDDRSVIQWDLDDGSVVRTLHAGEPVRSLAISTDGALLASGGLDGTMRLWRIESAEQIRAWKPHATTVSGLAFTPDGGLVSASFDGTVRVFDSAGNQTGRMEFDRLGASALAIDQSGRRIAVAGYALARVYDLPSLRAVCELRGHDGWIFGVDISSDGAHVATCGYDRTVRVWDGNSAREVQRIDGHTDAVRSVRFVQGDGLISGGDDERICAWRTDGALVASYPSESWIVSAVAPLPNGRGAVSASWDGGLRVWVLSHRR